MAKANLAGVTIGGVGQELSNAINQLQSVESIEDFQVSNPNLVLIITHNECLIVSREGTCRFPLSLMTSWSRVTQGRATYLRIVHGRTHTHNIYVPNADRLKTPGGELNVGVSAALRAEAKTFA